MLSNTLQKKKVSSDTTPTSSQKEVGKHYAKINPRLVLSTAPLNEQDGDLTLDVVVDSTFATSLS